MSITATYLRSAADELDELRNERTGIDKVLELTRLHLDTERAAHAETKRKLADAQAWMDQHNPADCDKSPLLATLAETKRELEEMRAWMSAELNALARERDEARERLRFSEAHDRVVSRHLATAVEALEGTAGVDCYATIRIKLRCFPHDLCSSCRARKALAAIRGTEGK